MYPLSKLVCKYFSGSYEACSSTCIVVLEKEATWLYDSSHTFTLESKSALVTLAHQAVCSHSFHLYLDCRHSQDNFRCQHGKLINKRGQKRSRPAYFVSTACLLGCDRQGECGPSCGEEHIPTYQRASAGATVDHALGTTKGGYYRAEHASRTSNLA